MATCITEGSRILFPTHYRQALPTITLLMNIKVTFIFIAFISLPLIGQDLENMDSLKRAEIELMMKEMQMRQKRYQPEKLEDFSSYFHPALIDSIFLFIQEDRYTEFYDSSSELFQKIQSEEDLVKYFGEIKNVYGKLLKYEDDIYYVKNQMRSSNKIASGTYDVVFEKVEGKIILDFVVIDSLDIKLQQFQIKTEDYTQIEKFDKIVSPTLNFLKKKEYPALYNSTTKRFQDYTPIAKFEEFVVQLDSIDFSEYKLYQNHIGVIKNKLIYYLLYEVDNGKGVMTLTYVESENDYLLEGLNYKPNEN